jgi:hypothetical protein
VCARILAAARARDGGAAEAARPRRRKAPKTQDGAARAWLAECVAACVADPAPGQLDCYERVQTARDLEACMVR